MGLFQELSRILVGVVATRGVIYDRVRKEGLEYDVKRAMRSLHALRLVEMTVVGSR